MKRKFFQIITIIFLFVFFSLTIDVKAADFVIGEHVYYDPVSSTTCNYKNYWTIHNQTGTCYRFSVVSESGNNVKLLLDHNLEVTTFNDYQRVLNEAKEKWTRYKGTIDLLSENEIISLLQISKAPEIDEKLQGEADLEFVKENSIYFINGEKYTGNGFWSKTLHKDSNYAYTINNTAYNVPVKITNKRGVRPVITVDKSLITKEKSTKDLSSKMTKKYGYNKYEHSNYTYNQMQGFTFANDKLFFYSNNGDNTEIGLLFGYGGSNFKTSLGHYSGSMGHGNDLTYNTKTKKLILVGANKYYDVYEFNPDTFTTKEENIYHLKDTLDRKLITIAYDSKEDMYYGKYDINLANMDTKFQAIKDSFSIGKIMVGQGLDFYNGYVYATTFESTYCPSKYQLYCTGKKDSSIIEVYNVKYNSDGTKSPNFGRLVNRYFLDGINKGEIEGISFKDNNIIIGYASKRYDSTETFQFYSIPKTEMEQSVNYSLKYSDGKAIITSPEDFASSSTMTLSTDKKTLTKTLSQTEAETEKICDIYSNCKNVSLKMADTITFSNTETVYTGSPINIDNASSKSNTKITYSYYNDATCSNKIDPPTEVGQYYVKAQSAGNDTYAPNSKCSQLTVNKGTPIISLTAKEAEYTKSPIEANPATAKTQNQVAVNLNYTYEYFTDEACTTKTKAENGITTEGGAPIEAGQYYTIATSLSNKNLNSASSTCTSHKIIPATPNFTINTSVKMNKNSSTAINYNYSGNAKLTCETDNEDSASCSFENQKLKITSKNPGQATLTINIAEEKNYKARNDIKVNVNVLDYETDSIPPVISISPDGNNKYSKEENIKVTITDNETNLKAKQNVYYAFSTSESNSPTYEKYVTTTNDENAPTTTIDIPKTDIANLTGTYYLWIKGGIQDANSNESVEKVSNAFLFNNQKPEVSATVINSSKKTKITIQAKSLSKIVEYAYSTDNENYEKSENNIFLINNTSNKKFYLRVTDELGNVETIEKESVKEPAPTLTSYIIDKDNNKVTNNIIDTSTKSLTYNILFTIPSLSNIIDKYEQFTIENTFPNEVTLKEKETKIYNKSSTDVTNDFNLKYSDNKLIITPKKIAKETFYDENYKVELRADINANYEPSSKNLGLLSLTTNLSVDGITNTTKVTTKYAYEEYQDIPNTFFDLTVFKLIGILLILLGSIIIVKNNQLKQM